MTTSESRKSLQHLVQILHDGQVGFRHAAENVKNPRLKELFDRLSLQRSSFAGQLENELLGLGDKDPEKEGTTTAGSVHRVWIDLKAAVMGHNDHSVLSEAERGEDVAKKAYKDALEKEGLPAFILQIIAKQATAIQLAHDEVKALRDATK